VSDHVQGHTRTLANGRTVQVRPHDRASTTPAAVPLSERDQDRRDRLERRVLKERQDQDKATRTGKPARTPGQKTKRKPKAVTKAKGRVRKAKRLWRRHKARAIGYGLLAAAGLAAFGVRHASSRTWKAASKAIRKTRKGKRRRR
jgi:hypothetical protein